MQVENKPFCLVSVLAKKNSENNDMIAQKTHGNHIGETVSRKKINCSALKISQSFVDYHKPRRNSKELASSFLPLSFGNPLSPLFVPTHHL